MLPFKTKLRFVISNRERNLKKMTMLRKPPNKSTEHKDIENANLLLAITPTRIERVEYIILNGVKESDFFEYIQQLKFEINKAYSLVL